MDEEKKFWRIFMKEAPSSIIGYLVIEESGTLLVVYIRDNILDFLTFVVMFGEEERR